MPEHRIRAALAALAAAVRQGHLAGRRALPGDWEAVEHALRAGPDPEGACLRAAALPDPLLATPLPDAAVTLLHQGAYPARLLGLHPPALEDLARPATAPDRADLAAWLSGGPERLPQVRTRAYLIAARLEAEGAPLEVVGGLLSDLAGAAVESALTPELAEDVVVFGMGKLGGRELNFLSDIDLLFVHRDGASAPRVLAALRTVVRTLGGQGPMAPLFHVDLRLRPFGRRGPLALSMSATEAYYERHGQDWERQVWLRATPIAGNLDLGVTLLHRLRPFVYRRSVTPSIFDEISALMLRARREARAAAPCEGIDLKHDAGGIRDVEFFAQALQLLRGGRVPSLRTPSTLAALDRLLAAGLISDREHRTLVPAYRLLRRLEHRVQLAQGVPTHRLPHGGPQRAVLQARVTASLTLGHPGPDAPDLRDDLYAALDRTRARVAAIAETIHGPSRDRAVRAHLDAHAHALEVALDPGAPARAHVAALSALGVQDAQQAQLEIQHLYARADSPWTAHGATRAGARRLLAACLDSADPDAAIQRLGRLAAQHPRTHPVWRLLASDAPAHAEAARLCAELLGSSEPLARGLIGAGPHHRAPTDDPMDVLLAATAADELPDRARIAAIWASLGDEGATGARLLQLRRRALVQIGLFDLGRRPSPIDVGASLSAVADHVLRVLAEELPAPADAAPFDLCVLALGKLGMEAMDYGSDLDLSIVYAPVDPHASELALRAPVTRTARLLLRRLGDRAAGERLYEVDMRLRPSGRDGLLVSGIAAFRRFHEADLPTWERLALLRARPVLERRLGAPGPASGALTREITGQILPGTLWERPPEPSRVARDLRRLLARIEGELAREHQNTYHVKAGPGGVLALELLVGALQLVHGPTRPSVRLRGILPAIEALAAAGCVDPPTARDLSEAYTFLRLLLNRLRLGHLRGLSDPERFCVDTPALPVVARRMGLADRHALVRAFHGHRRVVREALDRLLPSP